MKISGSTRRVYTPLSIKTGYRTEGSALAQVYKAADGAYEPNRLVTPTLIVPVIEVEDKDGIIKSGNANHLLDEVKWFADGVAVDNSYLVNNSASELRGSLTVQKNVSEMKPVHYSMRSSIADPRTGRVIDIALDNIIASTQVVDADKYSIETDQPQEILYNPVTGADILTVGTTVHRGEKKVTSDAALSYKLFYVNGNAHIEADAGNSPEVRSFAQGTAVIDLRMIKKKDYVVKLYKNGKEACFAAFSVLRHYLPVKADVLLYGDVSPWQRTIYADAVVYSGPGLVRNPERFYEIVWQTESALAGTVEHNTGNRAEIPVEKTGLENGSIKVGFDINPKEEMSVFTDSGGTVYAVDGTGIIGN